MNKEDYGAVVHYYMNNSENKKQKYITIQLPDESNLKENDYVCISITKKEPSSFVTTPSNKRITIGTILRQMNISDVATFDISRWNTIRSVASQLKRFYGCTFSVRKDKNDNKNIIVTRLS